MRICLEYSNLLALNYIHDYLKLKKNVLWQQENFPLSEKKYGAASFRRQSLDRLTFADCILANWEERENNHDFTMAWIGQGDMV